MFEHIQQPICDQKVQLDSTIELVIKRLDLIHPEISGNKFYKLKYNLLEAKRLGKKRIISFGGAYSNHIAATAYAAKLFGFECIGIIRGEELANKPLNHTLATAERHAMKLEYVSREKYRHKNQAEFLKELSEKYPESYIIPEGGTNALAIQGCQEILSAQDLEYDYIACAVGTGGTISGIIEASQDHQKILGFSALKGDFLKQEISQWTQKTNWQITDQYCFGGYAKFSPELLNFIDEFEQKYQIPLDPVYTGKMCFGIFELLKQDYFPKHSRILLIHSGGLQGKRAKH